MFSGGKAIVDVGAGITPIVLSIASCAGIIEPILTCLLVLCPSFGAS